MAWVGFKPTIPGSEQVKTVDALDRVATVTGYLWRFTHLENAHGSHQTVGEVGPRAGLGHYGVEKNLISARNRTPAIQPVAIRKFHTIINTDKALDASVADVVLYRMAEQEIVIASRPGLGPNQSPVQLAPEDLSLV
jgi:hypothetical protein